MEKKKKKDFSTAAGHRCPVLLSRTSDASLAFWQIRHEAQVNGYAQSCVPRPSTAFCPCFYRPGNRMSRESLGLAGLVTADAGSSTLLKTELGFFPFLSALPPSRK